MERTILFLIVGWLLSVALVHGQEIYQWVDERGTVHFTDDFSKIPEKYQGQAKGRKTPKEHAPSSPVSPPQSKGAPEPSVEKKDILGRGEDWWRNQAMEWKQKLINAQKDYATAEAALKGKEKELEDAKFKPKRFQRKLQDEVRVLEQKLNEQKKKVDEAKTMLESVLPRQAEEYRADPRWVKVD